MTDFPALIHALNAAGYPNTILGKIVGVSGTTIANWAKGHGRPHHDQGVQLLELQEKLTVKLGSNATNR